MKRGLSRLALLAIAVGCGGSPAAAGRPTPVPRREPAASAPASTTATPAATRATPPTAPATRPAATAPAASAPNGIASVRNGEFDAALSSRKTALITAGRRIAREEVGYYMDVQEARLRQLGSNGLKVSRNELSITIELPGSLGFESGSAALSPRAAALLTSVAKVLVDYRFSIVSVHGYTDNSGDSTQNLALSEQRAIAVARQLLTDSVALDRLLVVGHGSADPVNSNETPEGREMNRRIVLQIDPLVP